MGHKELVAKGLVGQVYYVYSDAERMDVAYV